MKLNLCAIISVCVISSPVLAEKSILDRVSKVTSKLEVLNSLARDCEARLQVKGDQGAQTKECEKYLKNFNGRYFASITTECRSLIKWYEETRKSITAKSNSNLMNKQMKAVNNTCNTDAWSTQYMFLTKPLETLNALNELE